MGRICYYLIRMTDPIETAELVAFAKTVEAKSLSRAAAELRLPRATISRRLARLEQRLKTRLLRRTTRRLALTPAGEAFYRHARIVLDAVERAECSVRENDDVIRGELRVAVPPIMEPSFSDMLCQFAARYPEVRLHVHFASQLVDLHGGGYDVALRAGLEFEAGLVQRTLARMPLLAVASPAYLERHGRPRSARDLRQHRCLLGFARGELPQTYWALSSKRKIHVEGVLCSNELTLLCNAAVQGLGIAYLPSTLVQPFIDSGELEQVLPRILEAQSQVAVVYPERAFVPAAVRAFVDAVVAWAPAGLASSLATGVRQKSQDKSKPRSASK